MEPALEPGLAWCPAGIGFWPGASGPQFPTRWLRQALGPGLSHSSALRAVPCQPSPLLSGHITDGMGQKSGAWASDGAEVRGWG